MDSIIEKFYNGGGQGELNKFTQFGGFPTGLSHSSKSPLPVRPMISTINSAMHNTVNKPNITLNTNLSNNRLVSQKDFMKPQNLAFGSSSDLLYNNPVTATNKRYNSAFNSLQDNIYSETKKNNTKMQMMEEKMKNLELKSQRLEVINDFFFDMFENNLVKDEINKQREKAAKLQKQKNKEEGLDSSSSSSSSSEINSRRKKRKKKKKNGKLNLNDYDKEKEREKKKEEVFDPQKYQQKTFQNTKDVLDNIKKNVSNYLFEEELKKNEQLQIMGEEINELKSKLVNQLEKMQMNQKHQMEKIAFCLLNSGNGKIEDLALHVFNSAPTDSKKNTGKNSMVNTRRGSSQKISKMNSRKGSIYNSGKGSLYNETVKSNGTKVEIPNSQAILQAVGKDIIPEENEENENENAGKKLTRMSSIKSKFKK